MGRPRAAGLSCAALVLALASCTSNGGAPAPVAGADAGDAAVPQIKMPTGDPLSWPVDAVGPFNVGHKVITLTYTPPAGAPSRTIPVDLFYPTLDADGDHPTFKAIFHDNTAFENASVAPPIDPAGYPVHVYSHGSSGFGGTASHMADWFASHGWVYVAPNHIGNTLGDPMEHPLSIYFLRSTDISAALDAVEHLTAPDPLAGKLRTKRVLLSGHSFGAFTAWASAGVTFDTTALKTHCDANEFAAPCTPAEIALFGNGIGDPRVVASIPMAGGPFDWIASYDAPNKPMLMMSGSADVSGAPIFMRTTTLDVTWIEFQGACHELFALGGCSGFDEKLGWALTSTWALAWGRRFVLGDAGARVTQIVTNAVPLSDRIAYQHKNTLSPPAGP